MAVKAKRWGVAVDVFKAFSGAIITDDWKLGELVENTEVGKLWKNLGFKAVIADEVADGELNRSPNAETIASDTLIYAKPEDIPTTSVAELIASYYWYQVSADQYYRIIEVGVGKNQDTGKVEHIEFRVRPTELAGESEDES